MYLEGYENPGLTQANARASAEVIVNCAFCEGCTVQCSQKSNIKSAAGVVFAVYGIMPAAS